MINIPSPAAPDKTIPGQANSADTLRCRGCWELMLRQFPSLCIRRLGIDLPMHARLRTGKDWHESEMSVQVDSPSMSACSN